MNDPISDENAPVKPKQIREWVELPDDISAVITVDPAYSDHERADFKVAALVGITPQYKRYLIKYIQTHAPQGEFINSVLNMYLEHKGIITNIGLPNSGVEKEFFRTFNRICEERGVHPPIAEIKNVFTDSTGVSYRKKKNRIIATLQPLFEAGKYFIHGSHVEAKDEILRIGSSRNDDIVDALSSAEQILSPGFMPREEKRVDRYGMPQIIGYQQKSDFGYGY